MTQRAPEAIILLGKLIVADLSPVHQYRKDQGLYKGGFAGSHSDINISEIYHLVAGFFFGVTTNAPLPVSIAPPPPLSPQQ